MSIISDFYSNSVKGQIGKDNWARVSEGKADPDILAIAKLCAVATGKETINDAREQQALIAKATKGLQKLGLGKNLPNVDNTQPATSEGQEGLTGNSNPAINTGANSGGTHTEEPAPSQDQDNEDKSIDGLNQRIKTTLIQLAAPNLSEEDEKKLKNEIARLQHVRDELIKEEQLQNKAQSEADKAAAAAETEEQKAAKAAADAADKKAREEQQAKEKAEREQKNRAEELERMVLAEESRILREAQKQHPDSFKNNSNSNRGNGWIKGQEISIGISMDRIPTREDALLSTARDMSKALNIPVSNEDNFYTIARKMALAKFNERYPNQAQIPAEDKEEVA